MFMSRVRIKLCENSLLYLDGLAKKDAYAVHQLLWNLFPSEPDAQRDFLFREEQSEGWPLYYVLSQRAPVKFSELFTIETKPFNPEVFTGQKLNFDIRVNPVVAKRVEGKKNSVHHDVWMDAKCKAKQEKLSIDETEKMIYDSTMKWIIDRSEINGFKIDTHCLLISAYQQHRAVKKSSPVLQYSTVDYKGVLEVINCEKFKDVLKSGIGRAKAFGCGLMLIKPCN